jgi:DNA-binding PadR family transcriptional regulator
MTARQSPQQDSSGNVAISALGYGLLSLLARASLSGYGLRREMQKPHSFFFGQAHVSQIYPELARLETAGLVTHTLTEQQSGPIKKVYTISPDGLQRLIHWVTEPTPTLEVRNEFLIKAHSLWLADPVAALPQFHAQVRYHEEQLAAYEKDLAELEREWGPEIVQMETPRFGDYLTVKRGVGYEHEYLAWLKWVIAILKQRHAHS